MVFALAQPAFAIDDKAVLTNVEEVVETETPVDAEEPVDPIEPVNPAEPVDDTDVEIGGHGYIDCLRYRFKHGFEITSGMGLAILIAPISFISIFIPFFGPAGIAAGVVTLLSPFYLILGIGEMAFSPIIAIFDVIFKTEFNN